MTYISFIFALCCVCSFGIFFRVKLFADFAAVLCFMMITAFAVSTNDDHRNYIVFINSAELSLMEPLSAIYMSAVRGILPDYLYMSFWFAITYLVARQYGDRNYNIVVMFCLAPLGVVSVRFFLAALLLSVAFRSSVRLWRMAPLGIHYSTLPAVIFLFIKNNIFIFGLFSILFLFHLDRELFFRIISLGGVSYDRYATGDGAVGMGTLARYGGLPILVVLLHKRLGLSNSALQNVLVLLFAALTLRVGLADFEVVSRVSVILNCIALYLMIRERRSLATLVGVSYMFVGALMYCFFGWSLYPPIYADSDAWLNFGQSFQE